MKIIAFILLMVISQNSLVLGQKPEHTFAFSDKEFILDGKPFQIISGEMHPARIPAEYWQHRIRMAKAMGCNTISAYIFWNYHEIAEGVFDFNTWNRDLARFVSIAQQEGLWVILRPDPMFALSGILAGCRPIF